MSEIKITEILSARGSIIFPNSDTCFNLLARNPSSRSEKYIHRTKIIINVFSDSKSVSIRKQTGIRSTILKTEIKFDI